MVDFYARRLGSSLALALLIQLSGPTRVSASSRLLQNPNATWGMRNNTQENGQQLPLKKVLAALEQQYKVRINYTGNTIHGVKLRAPAGIHHGQRLVDYLNSFLFPLGLEAEEANAGDFIIYKIRDKQKPTQKPTINSTTEEVPTATVAGNTVPIQLEKIQQDGRTITGQVTEESGLPLPGVTVVVRGTFNGAKSNEKGKFILNNVPVNAVLVFSYIGYKSQEIKAGSHSEIDVKLLTDAQSLKDVVVNGYQKLNKDSYTGSAIVISAEEIKRFNPTNLLSSIASYDPSFKLVDNNVGGSNPNALPSVNVRGTTSAVSSGTASALSRAQLNNVTNLPLFILDNYQVGIETIFDLDISRIETITLLKDAAATAIYGSRASNGVVVIRTRVPKEGQLEVTYNYMLGVTTPDLTAYHLLNAAQKLEYEKEAGLYKSNNVDDPDALEQDYYNKRRNVLAGVYTDWIAQPVATAYSHNNSLSLSGGTHDLRYSMDGRYQTDAGVMKNSGRNRANIGNTLSYSIKNNKILFRNNFMLTQMKSQESPYGSSADAYGSSFGPYVRFSDYVLMNPYYPKTDSLGRLLQNVDKWNFRDPNIGNAPNSSTILNPLWDAHTSSFNKSQYLEFIENFGGEYNPSPNLKISGNISVTKRNSSNDKFVSPLANEFYYYGSDRIKDRGKYYYTTTGETNVDGSLTAMYNKLINGSHALNFSLGTNIQTTKYDQRNIVAQGFSNDRFTGLTFAREYSTDDGEKAPAGYVEETRLIGFLASSNYSYQNRFLMDATMRVDGSSKFGANARFAPFGAVGLGWNLHNEKFLRNSAINQLRIKGTMGVTGSDEFPAYLSNTTYDYYVNDWYATGVGAVFTTYGNQNLKWSRTTNYEGTVELSAFHDRLYVSPHYYYKLTKDLINDMNVAPSTGFTSYKENIGNVVNKGYELYLRANILRARTWSVNLSANLAHNTNVLTKLSNSLKSYNDLVNKHSSDSALRSVPLQRYQEGRSMSTIYAVKSLGIDPEMGKEIYLNKDGKTTTYVYDVTQTVPVGDNLPKVSGNFGISAVYKNFMVEARFSASFGADVYNETLERMVENADPRQNVDIRALTSRWKQPGDHTFFKDIADLSQTQTTSRFVQRENKIQWSSLYASWDAPTKVYSRLKMKSLRFSFNMNDLSYWSNVQQMRGIEYPFARSFTCSLSTRF
ncbi:TonB-linked outer membrane protein, SusC/RagA family [Chitinophaga costaii]|uniref:TonB-linked outer membrane protein, SusC/RagA family n=1 Tax=Chitinophaga costaii TaxID=1335309 RepID=A0A1C4AX70_9BACT|nr:SusC/RagA family TonB-linked outer membrane protein [Chitinophaga costaii]PUZ26785.1 SusC/RagA family TonB-linked outer membrane protein [Chitinophaga costaii]SCB99233.1 TonB-linked outer membrane protein, SusC/RagA family [Chitinophaga costaii]